MSSQRKSRAIQAYVDPEIDKEIKGLASAYTLPRSAVVSDLLLIALRELRLLDRGRPISLELLVQSDLYKSD